MRDGKSGRLLRKTKRQFPNENDSCVYKNRKRSVLEFTGQIAADPRVRTEQGPLTFAPTPRDVRENRQDGKLVVVIPKKEWIVREKEEAKRDHDQSRSDRADYTGTRRPRVEHRAILTPNDERRRKQTPNAQQPALSASRMGPTPNAQWKRQQTPNAERPTSNAEHRKETSNAQRPALSGSRTGPTLNVRGKHQQTSNTERGTPNGEFVTWPLHSSFFSAVRMLATKILISSSASFRHGLRLTGALSLLSRATRRSHRLVSRSSFKQIFSL